MCLEAETKPRLHLYWKQIHGLQHTRGTTFGSGEIVFFLPWFIWLQMDGHNASHSIQLREVREWFGNLIDF